MTKTIAILAGGLATRLHPLTVNVPKSLIPILNRPFIEWQLELLATRNVQSVVLCLGHKAKEIIEVVGNGSRFGIKVNYSVEEKQLGTAGALKFARPLLGDSFGVLYGDSYLPINYLDIFQEFSNSSRSVMMTIFKNRNRFDKSNISINGQGHIVYSKKYLSKEMTHIDYGFSVLQAELLQRIKSDTKCDLSELFEKLSSENEIEPYQITQRFYEIGSFEGILELENYLKKEKQ